MSNFLLSISLIFILTSCGQDMSSTNFSAGSSTSTSSSSTCGCNTDSYPVCANVNGRNVTFKNGCLAQCSGYRYTTGSCTGDDCDSNSGAVCGIINEDLSPRIYSNECSLLQAGADQVVDSRCNL